MRAGAAVALLAFLLSGCRTAHDVAEDSYRAASAPVNVVREQPAQATAPNGSVPAGPQTATPSTSVGQTQAPLPPSADQRPAGEDPKPRAAASPRSSSLQFPTAKPVEGKPGYVYSPYDPEKYVDVSGYAPGSKVKDPYSGKIFLVP